MDIVKDILEIAEKIGCVPGLSAAGSIVVSIINTVKTSNANKARLTTLAHSVTYQLLSVSAVMHGQWDHAPHDLRRHINEFEIILREILKVVTKYSKSSRLRAFLNASEREQDITGLEKRLADIQRTVMILMGATASLALNQVQISLKSHGHPSDRSAAGIDGASQSDLDWPDDFAKYSRDDIRLMKTLSRSIIDSSGGEGAVLTTLYRGEYRVGGRHVLVKTYEGPDPTAIQRVFKQDLLKCERRWHPSILQFLGRSSSTVSIPFQVYQTPGDRVEPFWDWVWRTSRSNPVETIFGLYDMRISLKDLLDFERTNSVRCHDRLSESVVLLLPHDGRLRFSLVYVAGLEDSESWHNMNSLSIGYMNLNDPFHFNSRGLRVADPVVTLASSFSGGSEAWFEDMYNLEAVFKESFDTIDPVWLGSALFEGGWLGTCRSRVTPGGNLRLGDVGYTTREGQFVIVDNIHQFLISQDGGKPGWTDAFDNYAMSDDMKVIMEEEHTVFEQPGKLFRRCVFPRAARWFGYTCDLTYNDIDERWTWKVLQLRAAHIIQENGLSVSPHELQLVTSFTKYSNASVNDRFSTLPGMKPCQGAVEVNSDAHASQPTIYRFEQGEGILVQGSGVPELDKRVYYSFDSNLTNFNEDVWRGGKWNETSNDHELHFESHYCVDYLQLPPHVAHSSFVDEGLTAIP